jgi:hypothetical protein
LGLEVSIYKALKAALRADVNEQVKGGHENDEKWPKENILVINLLPS